MGLDPCRREAGKAHAGPEAELVGRVARREERDGGAVGEPGCVARGDAAAGPEGGAQRRETLERRLRAEELVAGGLRPARGGVHRERHDGHRVDAVGIVPVARRAALALERRTRRLPRG